MAGVLDVKIDASAAVAALGAAQKQLPFALSVGLNDLARQVQGANNAAMQGIFAHPRPFTANSTWITRATKSNLVATAFIRPEVAKYLEPYEVGGVHVLPGKGRTLLNPKGVPLDPFEQLRKNTLNRLIGRQDVFIGSVTFRKSGQTVAGVWQRPPKGEQRSGRRGTKGKLGTNGGVRTGLKLLIRFGDALTVTKRLGFHQRAAALILANASNVFSAAVAKALATAR
jgi:hypothetical protein